MLRSLHLVLAILTSFWTHIDYFKFLASHLTVFSYLSITFGRRLPPPGQSLSPCY